MLVNGADVEVRIKPIAHFDFIFLSESLFPIRFILCPLHEASAQPNS
jgi:hypothetical protein